MGTTRAQGYRDVKMNGLPFRGIAINDATSNTNAVTVYASDSGILFVNEFESTTTYTLPEVADCKGKWFIFYCNHATAVKVTAPTASFDLMQGGNSGTVTNADYVTSGGVVGNWGVIFGDGSSYFFFVGQGTWSASG